MLICMWRACVRACVRVCVCARVCACVRACVCRFRDTLFAAMRELAEVQFAVIKGKGEGGDVVSSLALLRRMEEEYLHKFVHLYSMEPSQVCKRVR